MSLEIFAKDVLETVLESLKKSDDIVEYLVAQEIEPYFDKVAKGIVISLSLHPGSYLNGRATIVIKTEHGLLKLRFKDLMREIHKEEKAKGKRKSKRKQQVKESPYWILENYVVVDKEGWTYRFLIDLTREQPTLVETMHKQIRHTHAVAL